MTMLFFRWDYFPWWLYRNAQGFSSDCYRKGYQKCFKDGVLRLLGRKGKENREGKSSWWRRKAFWDPYLIGKLGKIVLEFFRGRIRRKEILLFENFFILRYLRFEIISFKKLELFDEERIRFGTIQMWRIKFSSFFCLDINSF